jgi:hypothetical protein
MTRQGRILPLRCGERELRVFSHAARGTSHPPAQRYGVAGSEAATLSPNGALLLRRSLDC